MKCLTAPSPTNQNRVFKYAVVLFSLLITAALKIALTLLFLQQQNIKKKLKN